MKENRGDFAVCLKDEMIGQMLILENDENEFELGYVFHPSFWGHRYATEACIAALPYDFQDRKAPHVIACVREKNLRSLKILRYPGIFRDDE